MLYIDRANQRRALRAEPVLMLDFVALDGGCDRNGDLLALHHDLAAGDGHIIGQNPHLILVMSIKLDHGPAAHLQKLMDRQAGLAEDHGNFNGDRVDRIHTHALIKERRVMLPVH